MKQFTASANDAGVRLSRFVLRVTHRLPNSVLYKSFRTGRIKINGKKSPPEARLQAGDIVQLYLNDAYFPSAAGPAITDRPPAEPANVGAPAPLQHAASHGAGQAPACPVGGSVAPPAHTTGAPTRPPYGIVFENGDIAVLHKPAGLLCHSDASGASTLLRLFIEELINRGEYDPAAENGFAPALCNRLDRGTEGLILAAKTHPALRDANALLRQNLVQKTYLCVTAGTPPGGVHHAFLTRDRAAKTVCVTASAPTNDAAGPAKPITTGVRVLAQHAGLALCEIDLITGRTHQIRAHLAFLGAPVLGDAKYGNTATNRRFGQKGQLLCAWRLAFPATLPAENTLGALAGRSFSAQPNTVRAWWQRHANPTKP